MRNFKELKIWQKGFEIAVKSITLTATFPKEEKYGLIAQVRDCCTSIPSNIAEGAGRNTNKQFRHFLEISMGSANELLTRLELARRLNFIDNETAYKLLDEIAQVYKMILGFFNTLGE